MTRRDLMQRLGVDELREWLAYDRICPFEDGYWQAAMIAFVVAKANGTKKVKFEDFLPTRQATKGRRKQSGAEMASIVRRAVAAVERNKGS